MRCPLFFILFVYPRVVIESAHKVAIIGGGVGGSATAYFINRLIGDSVEIDLYEKSERIGGRVYALPFQQNKYEAGGSILHPRNIYATALMEKFGLKKSHGCSESGLAGIYNGKDFVFEESRYNSINIVKLLWRYGLSLPRMQSLVKRMLDLFDMIYMLQKSGRSFENVDEMLQTVSVNFPSFANQTLREHLKSQISSNEKLIDELAQAITLVNYGQSVDDLHAFVGSVSIAGSGGGLWSIEGGNELLPKALASHSEAKVLLETAVSKLKLLANGKYELTDSNSNVDTYDMVILAHPLVLSDLKFFNLPKEVTEHIENERSERKYHLTVATFIAGKRTSYEAEKLAQVIVSCNESFFFSRSQLCPLFPTNSSEQAHTKDVYKVFSRAILTEEQLNLLFSEISAIEVIPWMAYPDYDAKNNLGRSFTKDRFVLHTGLFYNNAIEWAASAIEMSLISAQNTALLVKKYVQAET
ncbi:Prenylcysteine oxidase [Halotydeus destructor]|nr:Prenylcysteine oxidase [Halotydeus destructor]